MMITIDSETQQVNKPLEENHLLSLSEISKIIQYKKNPKGIAETDYHLCCSEKNIDNPFMKLSTTCISFLTHVFHCHGCEDLLCQEFKKDLLHSLTCIDKSKMN